MPHGWRMQSGPSIWRLSFVGFCIEFKPLDSSFNIFYCGLPLSARELAPNILEFAISSSSCIITGMTKPQLPNHIVL